MSHHCAAELIDKQMNLHDYLKSAVSPGKRSLDEYEEESAAAYDSFALPIKIKIHDTVEFNAKRLTDDIIRFFSRFELRHQNIFFHGISVFLVRENAFILWKVLIKGKDVCVKCISILVCMKHTPLTCQIWITH